MLTVVYLYASNRNTQLKPITAPDTKSIAISFRTAYLSAVFPALHPPDAKYIIPRVASPSITLASTISPLARGICLTRGPNVPQIIIANTSLIYAFCFMVYLVFCCSTSLTELYLSLNTGFSILPVGFLGTSANMIL